MTQITKGIRSILSYPIVYTSFQYLMGAKRSWTNIANNYIKAKQGNTFLDIGCGPADILDYLPAVEYWGFDISEQYIQKAQLKYADRGNFNAQYLDEATLDTLPKFDIVLMCGVLHHMDDDTAKATIKLAHKALKTGGRLVTIDPCFTPKQNWFARFLIENDRGQNVRVEAAYKALIGRSFNHLEVRVEHQAWIPYTHCYMVCTK